MEFKGDMTKEFWVKQFKIDIQRLEDKLKKYKLHLKLAKQNYDYKSISYYSKEVKEVKEFLKGVKDYVRENS